MFVGIEGDVPCLAIVEGDGQLFRFRGGVHQADPGPPVGIRGDVGDIDVRGVHLFYRRDCRPIDPCLVKLRVALDRSQSLCQR